MQSWMFLASFADMRSRLLEERTISTMAHLGPRAFASIPGEVVQTVATIWKNVRLPQYMGTFFRILAGGEFEKMRALERQEGRFEGVSQNEFFDIPGSPISYWVSRVIRRTFREGLPIRDIAEPLRGVETGNNARFLRRWHEVDALKLGFNCRACVPGLKWYPYNKGGGARKWYGFRELVINWANDGFDMKHQEYSSGSRLPWRAPNHEYYFRTGITWTGVTTDQVTFRLSDYGALFDSISGSMMFPGEERLKKLLAYLNSKFVAVCLKILNPTINTQKEDIGNLRYIELSVDDERLVDDCVERCIEFSKQDESAFEINWDFQSLPILPDSSDATLTLKSSYTIWIKQNRESIAEMKRLEEENNGIFIDAYGLADEITPDVPIEQITLTVNPAYRYGGNLNEEEQWTRFRRETMEELISYAIGCMMGRYSLDEPGLIYAHAGNVGFDATHYKTFPADADGIIPITDELWFEDDAANRIREFLLAVWPAPTLDENMAWLAESLGTKGNETPAETIRRYLASNFFKDHCSIYKKRPIYWLFSSGKQGAFQALVYLHRYHEGTLARLRAEYVVPLTGKMQSRIEMLEKDKDAASSTAARNKIAKQIESLKKKHVELLAYDEKLRHYADMRISLDLDDGVKVNYGKFGDLLAEVKAVTGGAADD
jgi:type II restriction/modification system DNA methylase subunit YeeA